jgi:hypothetical protein
MSTPSTASQEPQIEDHDATRGLINATLMGALIWTFMVGIWNWVAA